MCEVNAFIYEKSGKETLYLENVDIIRPEKDRILLTNLFGEQRIFEGEVREISLIKHKILLEKKA